MTHAMTWRAGKWLVWAGVVGLMALFAGNANAFWCHSGGCYVSYSSCGSYGGYISYSPSYYGAYGSYGYGYSSCGSYGYGYSSYGRYPGYGAGTYGGSGNGATDSSQPRVPVPSTEARLRVRVPRSAIVYANGHRSKNTGTSRRYTKGDLKAGSIYEFDVRAEMMRDGKKIEQTKTLAVRAGSSAVVFFDLKNRLWTDNTGRYRAEASLLGTTGDGKVKLSRATTGATITLPLNRLSEADQQYVLQIAKN